MMLTELFKDSRIERIEFAELRGERPRSAGCNARRGVHGKELTERIVRLTIDGTQGFGWSSVAPTAAERLVGKTIGELQGEGNDGLVPTALLAVEFPLLDWLGRQLNRPVYELLGDDRSGVSLSVPCYDTSLYFDDLHLDRDADAVRLLQSQAEEGYANGHRHFKIKVGRGSRYMPYREGLDRDIAIVQGIREFAGPEAKLMVDANNGFNLNLTKEFLGRLEETRLYWLEEAFHEDDELYADLKDWMAGRGMEVFIADGEGLAAPTIVQWAEKGLIDVIQYDIRDYGFTNWARLGARLDRVRVKSAPHNYGSGYGGYVSGHLAASIENFGFVEWDAVRIDGIDGSGYRIAEGVLHIPQLPGFGLELDGGYFDKQVAARGWTV